MDKFISQLVIEINASRETDAHVGVAMGVAESRDLGYRNGTVILVAFLTPCLSINGLVVLRDGLPEALEFGFQSRIIKSFLGRCCRRRSARSAMSRILGTNHEVA